MASAGTGLSRSQGELSGSVRDFARGPGARFRKVRGKGIDQEKWRVRESLYGLLKLVPETKGKHLEEIPAEFQARVDRRHA